MFLYDDKQSTYRHGGQVANREGLLSVPLVGAYPGATHDQDE